MTLASTLYEKPTFPFQEFSHVNAFGVKLDPAINWLDISGFKLFDTLMAFLIFFLLKKVIFFFKKSTNYNKHAKLPNMQRVKWVSAQENMTVPWVKVQNF